LLLLISPDSIVVVSLPEAALLLLSQKEQQGQS
jgi:hypothetical protein